jgi:hypothetical protein
MADTSSGAERRGSLLPNSDLIGRVTNGALQPPPRSSPFQSCSKRSSLTSEPKEKTLPGINQVHRAWLNSSASSRSTANSVALWIPLHSFVESCGRTYYEQQVTQSPRSIRLLHP